MPELCAEVLSSSNTEAEMTEKRRLYFEGGAKEVWTVERDDRLAFYGPAGKLERSALAPDVPKKI